MIRAASRQYSEGLSVLLSGILNIFYYQGSFLRFDASKWLLVYRNTGTHNLCALVLQVMLKDIADSKRMNSNIKALPTVVTSPVRGRRQDAASISPLTSTVTSALFWPPHHQDTLKLPSQVQSAMQNHVCTVLHTQLACCCMAIWPCRRRLSSVFCFVVFVTLQHVGIHQSSYLTIRKALSWHSFSASCAEKHVASTLLLSRVLRDAFQSQA